MKQPLSVLLMLLFAALPATAAPIRPGADAPIRPGADAPIRYVSQRAGQAFLREGPSYAHRVLWIYRHRGTPFAVTASFDIWRRVRAADGTQGWMSANMLTDRRTVVVTGRGRARIQARAGGDRLVGLADPGAIANLRACVPRACEITAPGIDGWIDKSRIWGVGAGEVFR